jgi:hypothetical protein
MGTEFEKSNGGHKLSVIVWGLEAQGLRAAKAAKCENRVWVCGPSSGTALPYVNLVFLVALLEITSDSTITDISKHDHIVNANSTREIQRL